MARQLPVPPDIGGIIEEMVCKRRSNGRMANNVVIFVDIKEDRHMSGSSDDAAVAAARQVEAEVAGWVRDSLKENESMFHSLCTEGRGGMMWPWHMVSNVQVEEYHEVNRVVIAIHLDPIQHDEPNGFQWCADRLTIVAESPPKVMVSADDVLASLKPEPSFVTAVGVSAISDEVMMDIWHQICHDDITWCMRGEGRGRHPVWVRVTHEWQEKMDDADTFGWKGQGAQAWYGADL